MPVFDHMPMGEAGLQGIYTWIDDFVPGHSDIAEKIILGRSDNDAWEIPAIVVTNRGAEVVSLFQSP